MPLYLLATGLHLAAPSPSRSESDSPLTNRHEKGKEERVKPSSGGRISQSGYNIRPFLTTAKAPALIEDNKQIGQGTITTEAQIHITRPNQLSNRTRHLLFSQAILCDKIPGDTENQSRNHINLLMHKQAGAAPHASRAKHGFRGRHVSLT